MSEDVYSHSGVTIAVSATPLPTNTDLAGFQALDYIPVKHLGSLGEYGVATNYQAYDGFSTSVSKKSKGITDGGSPVLEFARVDDDPGQALMKAIGVAHNHKNYALRVIKQDGSIDYLRGLVSGPVHPGGRNEDFDLSVFTVAITQIVRHEEFSGGTWLFSGGPLSSAGVVTNSGMIPS